MKTLAEARMSNPNHTGFARDIREALRRAGEPLSVYKLFLATGIKVERIRRALTVMQSRTGGIISMRGPKGVLYALYDGQQQAKPSEVADGDFRIAGRITIPSYRWGSTRLG